MDSVRSPTNCGTSHSNQSRSFTFFQTKKFLTLRTFSPTVLNTSKWSEVWRTIKYLSWSGLDRTITSWVGCNGTLLINWSIMELNPTHKELQYFSTQSNPSKLEGARKTHMERKGKSSSWMIWAKESLKWSIGQMPTQTVTKVKRSNSLKVLSC